MNSANSTHQGVVPKAGSNVFLMALKQKLYSVQHRLSHFLADKDEIVNAGERTEVPAASVSFCDDGVCYLADGGRKSIAGNPMCNDTSDYVTARDDIQLVKLPTSVIGSENVLTGSASFRKLNWLQDNAPCEPMIDIDISDDQDFLHLDYVAP